MAPRKERHMHFVLTEAQYQTLSQDARRCGLTKRMYLIRLIENRPVKARPGKDIDQLRTEIHHIGNNINQLAKKFNAGYGTKEDTKTVEYLMGQVYDLMYQVAKE